MCSADGGGKSDGVTLEVENLRESKQSSQEVTCESQEETNTEEEEEEEQQQPADLGTSDQLSAPLEGETTVIKLPEKKDEEEVANTNEEAREEKRLVPEETVVMERPAINQENSDHQYSSGDYKQQAKELAEEQQEEEEEEEEPEESVVHHDTHTLYTLSPHIQGSETEVSLREEKLCTPVTEEDEDEEDLEEEQEEDRGEEENNRQEKEEGELMIEEDEDDQDSTKTSPATVVIEVRSEEEDDDDEEEEEEDGVEQDRVSEGSGITDDSENWDMSRGNLGLLEKAIALKAGEGKGGEEVQSSPEYHPYSSPSKSSQGATAARRAAACSKGEAFGSFCSQ